MVITVNTRTLSGDTTSSKILIDSFRVIAAANPQHEFVFIAEKKFANEYSDSSNVRQVVLEQNSVNPLWWKHWYNYRLPAVLKKYGAGVLIHADSVCSLRTPVPQCVLVNNDMPPVNAEWYPKNYYRFLQKNMTGFLQKANRIIAFSGDLKDDIVKKYKAEESKIAIVYPCTDAGFHPCDTRVAEKTKEKYTAGKEYFLFSGAIHPRNNLTAILKAFSLFKKRQKSNMQLLMVSDAAAGDIQFIESLRSYKYRDDIKLLENSGADLMQKITASAYACIGTAPLHTDLVPLLNAMQCGIPVIAGYTNYSVELLKGAALYVDASQPEDIAEKMMLLYKDENKRDELIKSGMKRAGHFSLDKTAAQIWQNIQAVQQV